MRLTKKIQAFTLTEVMVVIVLSAIVAGLAFSILGIVQKNMRSIESNYQYQSEIQSLEVALTIDLNKYPTANWDALKEELQISSPIDQKSYRFFSDSIVSTTDTYPIKIKNKTLYFEGEAVQSGNIDAIKFTFENTTNLHRIFVFKHNDPSIHF